VRRTGKCGLGVGAFGLKKPSVWWARCACWRCAFEARGSRVILRRDGGAVNQRPALCGLQLRGVSLRAWAVAAALAGNGGGLAEVCAKAGSASKIAAAMTVYGRMIHRKIPGPGVWPRISGQRACKAAACSCARWGR